MLAQGFSLGNLRKAERSLIHNIEPCQSILMPGAGTGNLVVFLYKSGYQGKVDVVDLSSRMLFRTRKNCLRYLNIEQCNKIRLIQANLLHWQSDSSYDAVLSAYILDVFSAEQLQVVFSNIHARLKKDALWLNTDFHLPSNRIQKVWQSPLVASLYLFFRIFCKLPANHLLDFPAYFKAHGWVLQSHKRFLFSMIQSHLYTKTVPIEQDSHA